MSHVEEHAPGPNFIKQIILKDREAGKHGGQIVTRFPPEPNGHLHIGHAKAICLNFSLAQEFGGRCHLRYDDTNPVAEDPAYVASIAEDIQWMGFSWGDHLYHASDYFEQLYDIACELIDKGLAYVDDLTPDQIREYRGTLTEPGKNSPYRDRSVQENIDLFRRMRAGEYKEGERVLRLKIDMASPNMNMRDPLIYRIRYATHQRTGDEWCIYPLYDYTHCLSDAFEGITHSLCTLEFEDHRPLYDWVVAKAETGHIPRQIEFARLNLDYTVTSKRKLLELVNEGMCSGWDDPRMPTIKGLRRRGYTPESIRLFCDRIGITKKDSTIDVGMLEAAIRDDLNAKAERRFAVLDPIKVTITNYPENEWEELEVPNHPQNEAMGTRKLPFGRVVYIDRDDFMMDPPKKFFRLGPDRDVRLRYAYVIHCDEVIQDAEGHVTELKCTYRKDTFGGVTPEGMKKVKGIIHWLPEQGSVPAEVRVYDRLFKEQNPVKDKAVDYKTHINPESLLVMKNARVEAGMAEAAPETRYQFERLGFFTSDWRDHSKSTPVFNRTVTLRDTWKK